VGVVVVMMMMMVVVVVVVVMMMMMMVMISGRGNDSGTMYATHLVSNSHVIRLIL
jgi:hypothetical protein